MKKFNKLFYIVAVLGTLSLPVSADAAIDAAGAADLKKTVEAELQWRKDMAKLTGRSLTTSGAVDVTPKGSYYEVKIPDVTMRMKPDRALVIGTIMINATPAQTPGEWQTSASVPQKMSVVDEKNMPLTTITLGKQLMRGRWVPAKYIWPEMELAYKDIELVGKAPNDFKGNIGAFMVHSAMQPETDGSNAWNSPTKVEALDITLGPAQKGVDRGLTIKRIGTSIHYRQMDINKIADTRRKVSELAASNKTLTAEETKILLSSTTGLFDALANDFTVEGVDVRNNDGVDPFTVSFSKLYVENQIQGALKDKATTTLKFGYTDMKTNLWLAYARLIPQNVNIEATVNNLPYRAMSDYLLKMLDQTNTPPAVVTELQQLLQKNGTYLTLQNSYLRAPDLDAALNGRFNADATAVKGISGKVVLTVKGIDAVIAKLQAEAAKPKADPRLAQTAMSLTAMKMMAQPMPGETGDNYVLEIAQDGRVLFNGANIDYLVKGAGSVLNDRVQNNPSQKPTAPPVPAPAAPPI